MNYQKSDVIFVHQNLISNRLPSYACKLNRWVNVLWIWRSLSQNFGHSESLSELFSLVNRWVKTKNDFAFWLICGL